MAKDPGGFLSFIPCFYFCCLRRRPENLANGSEVKLGSDVSSNEGGEDDKIKYDQSLGYGTLEEQETEPSWNDIAESYSIASQPGGDQSSDGEEGGEAITKPLESLSVATLRVEDVLGELETNLASESVVSSAGSTGEVHVLGEAETYSMSGRSATPSVRSYSSSPRGKMSPTLLRKVDTSSVDSWSISSKRGDHPSLMLRADAGSVDSWSSRKGDVTPSVRSMQGDTASMKSWTSRTEKTPSLRSMQAESAQVKSWSKGETASLERQREVASDLESGESLDDITEKSVEHDKSFSYEDLKNLPELDAAEDPVYSVPEKDRSSEPVPVIEIDSSNLAKESLRSKNSDDSGVVVDNNTSQAATFSDEIQPIRKSASMASLDSAGSTKKKKKIKLFKKFHFKKKKKNKLAAQQEQGVSVSTPSLAHHSDASNLSIKSRYSASLLLASLDDMSDDDICRD